MGKWLRRGLLVLLFILLAPLVAGLVFQAVGEAVDRRNYPPPGLLLDVGGFKMHLHCVGQGKPTVILDGASLASVSDWVWVQAQVSEITRVCAYDRQGIGWSDASPLAPLPGANAGELHELLNRAGEAGPYVLVGHSLGGLYVRAFAAAYPDEVDGLVLIEATPPDFLRRQGLDEKMPNADEGMLEMGPYAARVSLLRLLSFVQADTDLPEHQQAELKAYYSTARFADHSLALYRAFPQILAEVRGLGGLGDKPLAVVVGGASENGSGVLGDLQREIAGLSTNSSFDVVPGASHVSLVRNQDHARVTSEYVAQVVKRVRAIGAAADQ